MGEADVVPTVMGEAGVVTIVMGEADVGTTVMGEADVVLTVGAVVEPKNLMIMKTNPKYLDSLVQQNADINWNQHPVSGKLGNRKKKVDEAGEDNIDYYSDEGIEEEPEEPDDELEDREDYAEGEGRADV
ncbi:hypothetical protein BJ742DRAFT_778247 [Cladochytrium replicatum]|nr:hypothetical protein BJ742DRAFT_778247 [Cladochytrium replicatum]